MYDAVEKRKSLNLRQEDVADRVGISRQYYNMLENAKAEPSVAIAKKIGEVLEIDWTIFFTDKVNN